MIDPLEASLRVQWLLLLRPHQAALPPGPARCSLLGSSPLPAFLPWGERRAGVGSRVGGDWEPEAPAWHPVGPAKAGPSPRTPPVLARRHARPGGPEPARPPGR